MDDLDSKSSSSSDGYHFEIKEARERSRKQDKNATDPHALQIDIAIRNPGPDQEAMGKNKELDMRL